MTKEDLQHTPESEPMATGLADTFIQRWDLYAKQLDDGSYICIREPLEQSHLVAHLKGEITLGAYVLDRNSQARYIMFDADEDAQFEQLVLLSKNLAEKGVPSYLEESRRGGHLWLFFSDPIPGKDARLFGQGLAKRHNLDEMELFPKQDRLQNGPGSLVRLPFGIHRKTGLRYGFITPDNQPLAGILMDQYWILSAPERVPKGFVESKLTRASKSQVEPVLEGVDEPKTPLSTRIKNSVRAYDFIGQYVELSPAGRGLCPFHTDEHNSFSVNLEKNYWNCFAGCGGGSIIDFWMKWQGCEFTEALHELAEMLLPHAQKAEEPED